MNKKEIFLKQLAFTTYTSYDKLLKRYELCEENMNRLISLQEAIYMNPFDGINLTKDKITEIIKNNKNNYLFYFKLFPGVSSNSVVVKSLEGTHCISIPSVLKKNGDKWLYRVEIFNDRTKNWEEMTKSFSTYQDPEKHSLLCNVEGKRRNATLLQDTRIDILYSNPYDPKKSLILKSGWDIEKKEMGVPIFIENGKVVLFN